MILCKLVNKKVFRIHDHPQIAGDDRHDRLAAASVIGVVLDDEGRADLSRTRIGEREIDDDDVAPYDRYFW